MFRSWFRIAFVVTVMLFLMLPLSAVEKKENPKVILVTSMGEIELELYPDKASVSVENFLSYVQSGFYDSTIFHRVIDGFMIQGGGFDKDFNRKETLDPIVNEATNGLKNKRGTVAYARTGVINSATSQFFINLVDNDFLNYKNNTPQGYGYAVFGKVVRGMDVVDEIAKVKTGIQKGMKDVPKKPVVILSVKVIEEKEIKKK